MKELRPEVVADLALRSVLVCQQEAEAAGFPEEAAQDIWEGIMDDDTNGWSDREFLEWTKKMDKKYGCDSSVGINSFMGLYGACSAAISRLGEAMALIVDDDVPFEPNCPDCGHEDVHFQDRIWLCDCCGHSW